MSIVLGGWGRANRAQEQNRRDQEEKQRKKQQEEAEKIHQHRMYMAKRQELKPSIISEEDKKMIK